eukprot:m51a1_g1995 hypothetical protein (432) ;mRNA; f:1202719-1204388
MSGEGEKYVLPKRANRGKLMARLLEDEAKAAAAGAAPAPLAPAAPTDAEAEFWSADRWRDDDDDGDYDDGDRSETDDGSDDADSDFDAPEDDAGDAEADAQVDAENAAAARGPDVIDEDGDARKAKGRYVDPKKAKPRAARGGRAGSRSPAPKRARTSGRRARDGGEDEAPDTPAAAGAAAEEAEEERAQQQQQQQSAASSAAQTPRREEPAQPRVLRESTRSYSEQCAKNREHERVELQRRRMSRQSTRGALREPTQEERLAEAKITERENLRSLEEMLALYADRKSEALRKKEHRQTVPCYTWLSRQTTAEEAKTRSEEISALGESVIVPLPDIESRSATTLTVPADQPLSPSTAPPYPQRGVCEVSGLPAKYRDPLTGKEYANVAAFRVLRQNALQEDEHAAESYVGALSAALEDCRQRRRQMSLLVS